MGRRWGRGEAAGCRRRVPVGVLVWLMGGGGWAENPASLGALAGVGGAMWLRVHLGALFASF
jgi:hypothetical protein